MRHERELRTMNNIDKLREAQARIRELEAQVISWREAHERAAVMAAEECNRQKDEFEAQLAEANDRAAHHEAARLTYYDELCGVKAQLAEADGHIAHWQGIYQSACETLK